MRVATLSWPGGYCSEAPIRRSLQRISVDVQTIYTPLPVWEPSMRSGVNSHHSHHTLEIHCRDGPHIELIPVYETKEGRALDQRTKRPKVNR